MIVVIIRQKYQENVTSIGDKAFYNCTGLDEIGFKRGDITKIGEYAFYGCENINVALPDSVTSIGKYAFYDTGVRNVAIPEKLTDIGTNAFSNLNAIKVDAGNTKYDSRNNCNAVIDTETNELVIGCQQTEIPVSVTSIGDYAFL